MAVTTFVTIMSSKCFTCNESILSPEFIKCDGKCGQFFNSKCVYLNKTTLNAITSNANVHWFCHDCNSGNLTVMESIENLKDAVNQMSGSLATDLGNFTNGVKSLTESMIGSITKLSQANNHQRISNHSTVLSSNNKRLRESVTDESPAAPSKKLFWARMKMIELLRQQIL